ncbi:MAG TPA: sigma-70 family RNA polymerase sigma factor [Planctomycetota bacterium]
MTDLPSRPLDPAELLAQRAWMRRFAAALAGAEGEDLVQEAWVRVLSGRAPALARPRAWLAHVLRNAARMQKRGALRREQREVQAAREEALASTDELVAQAELEQLAVRAVLALPGLYRQALLLRYVRGLEPSEIARQLGLPPSTVRNRIARGLAEVRAELDRRHGRREAWLALLAPGAALGKGTATMVVGSGTWMSTKSIAACAALAAAAGLLWVGVTRRGDTGQAPASSAPSAFAHADPAPSAAELLADPPRAGASERREIVPPGVAAMTATELVVHVTWHDGTPTADLPLQVQSLEVEPYGLLTTGTTDASGTARFTALPPGPQWLDTLRDWAGYVHLVPGEPQTLELALPPGLDVDCRVVDRAGAGVAGAEVWLSEFGGGGPGLVVGRTDAGGWLALRDLPCQHRSLAARAGGHSPSTRREFRGLPGARLAVRLVLPGPGASLIGVVQDSSGTPLAGAEVLIGDQFPPGGERADGEEVAGAPQRHALSDADGSFLVHELAPGPLELQARAPGYATARAYVELAPNETGHCTLVLPAEASVAGVVRDGSGRPVAGVNITGAAHSDFRERWTRTAADGSFVLGGLEAGRCLLVADGDRADGGTTGHARTELELRAGEEARWDAVLTVGGVVAGVVLDERGAPLARWHVAAVEHEGSDDWLRSAYTDAAGRFRMEDCPAQRFLLALRAPEEEWGDPVLVVEDFQVGDEALVLRALDECRPSAFVEGRLVAADGGQLVEVELGLFSVRMGAALDTHVPDADGRFHIGPLRSGEYVLGAEAVLDESAGLYPFRRWRVALQAGETEDLGNLVLERGGWIRLRAVAQGGAALPPGPVLEDVQLLVDGEGLGWMSFVGTEGHSGPLAPGTYLVRSREGTWRAPDAEVEVRPGATTELELAFEPTTERLVEVVFPEGEPGSVLELRVLDAAGRAFDDIDDDLGAGRYSAWVGGLLPGGYTVEARAPDGRSASGELRVLDLAADETPLVLTLR